MESDWYDLVSRFFEATPAHEMKRMGEMVEKANTGVRRHGIDATVLSKIGSVKEEGSDAPGVKLLGPRADRKETWEAWVVEQANRERIVGVINRASHSIINKNLSRRNGEHEGDSSAEDESMPAGDTDDTETPQEQGVPAAAGANPTTRPAGATGNEAFVFKTGTSCLGRRCEVTRLCADAPDFAEL